LSGHWVLSGTVMQRLRGEAIGYVVGWAGEWEGSRVKTRLHQGPGTAQNRISRLSQRRARVEETGHGHPLTA
jgi:hypothetical protein